MGKQKRSGVDVRKGTRRKFNNAFAQKHFTHENGNGPPNMFYVYLLIDGETGYVGYIGVTKDPTTRKGQHRRDINDGTEKGDWLRMLRDWGREATFYIIAACPTYDDACIVERSLIRRHNLHNVVHRYKGEEIRQTFQYSFLAGKYDHDDIPY